MSLDETFHRMRLFAAALDRFDDSLRGSLQALAARHADVEPVWQDAFARQYAEAWAPMAEGMQRWCVHEGPAYREFVDGKVRALAEYLEGGR